MSTAEIKGKLPMFLVKPGTVSQKDIRRAERFCGVCIIECADPDSAKYSEAPLGADLDEQARAALALMRIIIASDSPTFHRGDLTKWFVAQLLSNRKPDSVAKVKTK